VRDLDVASVAHKVWAHLVQDALHVFQRQRQRAVVLRLLIVAVIINLPKPRSRTILSGEWRRGSTTEAWFGKSGKHWAHMKQVKAYAEAFSTGEQ
jgi:hypothetical protein